LACSILFLSLSFAQAQQNSTDLTSMSLQDLMKLEVITTIGKRQQRVSQIPAAVYVITADDIARAGITSIPEALRLAPGVDVAQVDASTWAISIRGFNSVLSNKLLVLVDGRSVYSSIFTQVYWTDLDLPLDDVERIEVIRGPGAALWGANAVNGVINIVTRNAHDTLGKRLALEAGSHDQAIADARYGKELGRDAAFRISSRYALRGTDDSLEGGDAHDRWDLQRASLRGDWNYGSRDSFNLDGDTYQSGGGETFAEPVFGPPYSVAENSLTLHSGGSLLLRWNHETAAGSRIVGQVYYDDSHQFQSGSGSATDKTLDFDFHEENHLSKRHDVLWGLGFRYIRENTTNSSTTSYIPNDKTLKLFSGFGQDEVSLLPNRLWLTIGTRLEDDPYTGIEIQPDLRLLWAPNQRQSVWAAVSRAVRTPAAFERRGHAVAAAVPGQGGLLTLLILNGSSQTVSEDLVAYEVGYRFQTKRRFSLDLTSFYDVYQHLTSIDSGTPFPATSPAPFHIVVPLFIGNAINGDSEGSELAATFAATPWWKLSGSYSWFRFLAHQNPAAPTATSTFGVGTDPEHQFQLHSYFSLRHHVDFDTSAYSVTTLPSLQVPNYVRLDAHIAWSPAERLKLSLGLQNLLSPRHLEFKDPILPVISAEVPRSFYGKVEWEF
jgi:iron complex outermembrane recepter protein